MQNLCWHICASPVKIVIVGLLGSVGLAVLVALLAISTLGLFLLGGMEMVWWIISMESCEFTCCSMALCPVTLVLGAFYVCLGDRRYPLYLAMWVHGFQELSKLIKKVILYGCGFEDDDEDDYPSILP